MRALPTEVKFDMLSKEYLRYTIIFVYVVFIIVVDEFCELSTLNFTLFFLKC